MRAGRNSELGRGGKLRQPAAVHNFTNTVLWIYIVLLLVGGMIGFLKAASKVSLISSSVFAAVLVLTQTGIFEPTVARDVTRNRLLDEILSFYGGRAQPMMAQLAEAGKLTLADVRELEKTIKRLEGQQKGGKEK